MKKYFLFCLSTIFIGWFVFIPRFAYAHFPAIDNDMTVVLHVDPDDSPIPGQPATLYFLFNDVTNKFKLAQCNCQVTIVEQGKQIFSQQLHKQRTSKPSIWGTNFPFSFPNRDIYKIVLTGSPVVSNAFQPFTVSWNFRVDNYPVQTTFPLIPFLTYLGIGIGISIVLLGSIFLFLRLLDKKRKK